METQVPLTVQVLQTEFHARKAFAFARIKTKYDEGLINGPELGQGPY